MSDKKNIAPSWYKEFYKWWKKFYFGVIEKSFKECFGNHTWDFKHPKHRNWTELSKYIWGLKDVYILPVIEWSIVTKVLSKLQLNFCKLCLSEKFYIIKSLNDPNILNKKSELVNTCRHQSKLLLKRFKKNRYSERRGAIDRYLVFDISSSVFDMSLCCNTFFRSSPTISSSFFINPKVFFFCFLVIVVFGNLLTNN